MVEVPGSSPVAPTRKPIEGVVARGLALRSFVDAD